MGYTLTIGNAALRYDAGDFHLAITAERASHPEAPDHCRFTGKGNSRSPSYTAWSEFCKEAGIHELFYGQGWDRQMRGYTSCTDDFHRETPLLASHPGCQPLCKGDYEFVRQARLKREQTNGGLCPGFRDDEDIDNGTDHVLARLLWLEFWIGWALENCQIPIIENT